jgi:hypothetical protein
VTAFMEDCIVIDAAKPECVKAMIDAGKKYGAKIRRV